MRTISALLITIFLSACGTQNVKPDPTTGRYPAWHTLTASEIQVSEPLAGVKSLPFVYLLTPAPSQADRLRSLAEAQLHQLGFAKVLSAEDLVQLVVQAGLAHQVRSVHNLISLHALSEIIGPFLIVQFSDESAGGIGVFTNQLSTTIFDPVQAKPVFKAVRRNIIWADFDKEFTYPMLNGIKGWFDASAALPSPPPTKGQTM